MIALASSTGSKRVGNIFICCLSATICLHQGEKEVMQFWTFRLCNFFEGIESA